MAVPQGNARHDDGSQSACYVSLLCVSNSVCGICNLQCGASMQKAMTELTALMSPVIEDSVDPTS